MRYAAGMTDRKPPPYNAAVSVQKGPAGDNVICLHLTTAQVNLSFALGDETAAEDFRLNLNKGLKQAIDASKRERLGLVLPGQGQRPVLPPPGP